MGKGTVLVVGSSADKLELQAGSELVTGQNPRSDQGLADMLVKALDRQSVDAFVRSPWDRSGYPVVLDFQMTVRHHAR